VAQFLIEEALLERIELEDLLEKIDVADRADQVAAVDSSRDRLNRILEQQQQAAG